MTNRYCYICKSHITGQNYVPLNGDARVSFQPVACFTCARAAIIGTTPPLAEELDAVNNGPGLDPNRVGSVNHSPSAWPYAHLR